MRRFASRLPLALVALLPAAPAAAITVTPPFVAENAVPGVTFTNPTGIVFVPGGRMLVIEKRGQVFVVNANGTRVATPMWSRMNEVLDHGDRGLLGIAVDPNYASNQFVYLLYTVDPDSNGTDNNDDAFARLMRYRVSAADSNTAGPGVAHRADRHRLALGRADRLALAHHRRAAVRQRRQPAGLDRRRRPVQRHGRRRRGPQPVRRDAHRSVRGHRRVPRAVHRQPGGQDPAHQSRRPATATRAIPTATAIPARCGRGCGATGCAIRSASRVRPGTGITDPAAGNPGTLYIGDVGYTHVGGG